MKLSRHSRAIYEIVNFPKVICKLIGEFSQFDIYQKRGDYFYEPFEVTGCSYLITDWGGKLFFPVSGNDYINCWKVMRATPCSLVLKYYATYITCKIHGGTLVRYKAMLDEYKNFTKRIFPFLREPFVEQDVLMSFIELHSTVLVNKPIRYKCSFTFLLSYEPAFYPYKQTLMNHPIEHD